MSGKGRTSCRTFVCDAANRPEPDLVVTRGELVTIETGAALDRDLLLEREPELADELATFFANQDHLDRLAGPPHARSHEPLIGADPESAADRAEPVPAILPNRPPGTRRSIRDARQSATSEITSCSR
ncbi:MAG: hypothetical protein ACLQU5_18910 [Isosphaeraceae bacterium]